VRSTQSDCELSSWPVLRIGSGRIGRTGHFHLSMKWRSKTCAPVGNRTAPGSPSASSSGGNGGFCGASVGVFGRVRQPRGGRGRRPVGRDDDLGHTGTSTSLSAKARLTCGPSAGNGERRERRQTGTYWHLDDWDGGSGALSTSGGPSGDSRYISPRCRNLDATSLVDGTRGGKRLTSESGNGVQRRHMHSPWSSRGKPREHGGATVFWGGGCGGSRR
jgi:hypothetical protein